MNIRSLLLHPGQVEVYNKRARFKVIVAGRRWGKTVYARTTMIKMGVVPDRLIWYVAPTYPMAKDIMWPSLLDCVPQDWIRKINETKMLITLRNGTRVQCKGADNPDSLRGVGLHHVVMDEYQDMDENIWPRIIRPTLATTGGSATFIGTPKQFNQLHREYLRGQDPLNRSWASWQFRTIDSPFVPIEEVEAARRDMDERSFKQELEASFETMGGRVYYPFDRTVHVTDLKFNPERPIWVGQDFNRDPMSSVIMQPQENGRVHVIDEIVLRNSSTEEVVTEIERRYWRHMSRTAVFPDPAGAYSQHARGETDLDIFRERGYVRIYHRKKHPKVADRVNCVNRMLKAADGSVRLLIDRKCKHLITSLEQTIYKEESREVDKTAGLEHSGDAIGYPIEYNFPLRKLRIAGVSL